MKIVNGKAMTDAAEKRVGTIHWVIDNQCANCGEPFSSISAAARYCSRSCKQSAYRERVRESNARQRFVTGKGAK